MTLYIPRKTCGEGIYRFLLGSAYMLLIRPTRHTSTSSRTARTTSSVSTPACHWRAMNASNTRTINVGEPSGSTGSAKRLKAKHRAPELPWVRVMYCTVRWLSEVNKYSRFSEGPVDTRQLRCLPKHFQVKKKQRKSIARSFVDCQPQ